MLRFVNICLVLGLVALAYGIYQVKYETRAFDERIATLTKEIEDERDALAVARAEWSLLNSPDRIDRLAQKYLNLKPAQPGQLVVLDEITEDDLARAEIVLPSTPAPVASSTQLGDTALHTSAQ